ncbi:NusA-like transcription termination signal-binding factor [Candidatus Woesearchaeota archaeon]|nr:NusA-like transcription termination signal-binding factor [Candidatus Woesearchaeota archaeon]
MKVKYDMETLQRMTLFEKVTRSRLKDYFEHNDKILFVVEKGFLRKALGENKKNVTRLEELLKRRIKIIEYSDSVERFIANVMAPLKIVEMKVEDGVVTITGPDQKTKGLMIGAKAANLRMYEGIVQKYYPQLKEIKVI